MRQGKALGIEKRNVGQIDLLAREDQMKIEVAQLCTLLVLTIA